MEGFEIPKKMTPAQLAEFFEGTFGELLRERGFSPYARNHCQWYKLLNDEVLQGVIALPPRYVSDNIQVVYACYSLYDGERIPFKWTGSLSDRQGIFNIVRFTPAEVRLAPDLIAHCEAGWPDIKVCSDIYAKGRWLIHTGPALSDWGTGTTTNFIYDLLTQYIFPRLDKVIDGKSNLDWQSSRVIEVYNEDSQTTPRPTDIWEGYLRAGLFADCVYFQVDEVCEWCRDFHFPHLIGEPYTKPDTRAYLEDLIQKLSEPGYETLRKELAATRDAAAKSVRRKLKL